MRIRPVFPAILVLTLVLPAFSPAAPETAGAPASAEPAKTVTPASPQVKAPATDLSTGSPAPAFSLNDFSRARFDLSSVLGKNAVVISFWSIYCDSCVKEMLTLQKLEDKYQGRGLTLLALNEDIRVPEERIVRFLDRLMKFRGKITYPILFDKDSAAFTAYRANYLPTTILIDKNGLVVSVHQGYDTESEPELMAEIDNLVSGKPALAEVTRPQRQEVLSVTGQAGLCGFYDQSGWKKSFTGSTSLEQEMVLTRDIARKDAQRTSLMEALRILGISLFANEPQRQCVDGRGIHLDRDPFTTNDPVSRLLAEFKYSKFFDLLDEQEKMIDGELFLAQTTRVSLDALMDELTSLGYITPPLRINITYVNMSPLDQKEFIRSMLAQSMFVGKVDNPIFTPATTSQAFEVYASTQDFAAEIQRMDFGKLKVFVEDVTPSSLELEVWK